jgi:hypothetical protein
VVSGECCRDFNRVDRANLIVGGHKAQEIDALAEDLRDLIDRYPALLVDVNPI